MNMDKMIEQAVREALSETLDEATADVTAMVKNADLDGGAREQMADREKANLASQLCIALLHMRGTQTSTPNELHQIAIHAGYMAQDAVDTALTPDPSTVSQEESE